MWRDGGGGSRLGSVAFVARSGMRCASTVWRPQGGGASSTMLLAKGPACHGGPAAGGGQEDAGRRAALPGGNHDGHGNRGGHCDHGPVNQPCTCAFGWDSSRSRRAAWRSLTASIRTARCATPSWLSTSDAWRSWRKGACVRAARSRFGAGRSDANRRGERRASREAATESKAGQGPSGIPLLSTPE